MSLVPVFGGLSEPVDRILPLRARKELAEDASSPRLRVEAGDLSVLHRIADGTLSPLEGPMTEALFTAVLRDRHIARAGRKFAWTIPLSLPVTDEEASKVAVGKRALLTDDRGVLVGALDVESIFDWDKPAYVESVYRTKRVDHPGADMVMKDPRGKLLGGKVSMFPPHFNADFGQYVLSPRQTRALIATKKWEAALAFQTRNPLHRAHEYALVYGVEELTRKGLYAGVVLNPLVGQLKSDDVDAVTRMRTYETLLKKRLLGAGGDADAEVWNKVGYELNDVFALVGLDMKMFYGGPSEAVMHSIYRQNHGFSHIVIGRKHADAPYFDGTAIWGDFDAQEIFGNLGAELNVQPVKVGFAAYYDSMGRVDLTANHEGEKPFNISGTKIRELLVNGERPDARIMRPETADVLIEAYKSKA